MSTRTSRRLSRGRSKQRSIPEVAELALLVDHLSAPTRMRTQKQCKRVGNILFGLLEGSRVFEDAGFNNILACELAKEATVRHVPANQDIVSQGDRAEEFYVLLKGRVEVKKMVKYEPKVLCYLGAPQSFGDLALTRSKCKRTATVTTKTPTILLVVNKRLFKRVLMAPVERSQQQRIDFLRSIPIFRDALETDVNTICAHLRVSRYKTGQRVCYPGDGRKLIQFIRHGECQEHCIGNPRSTFTEKQFNKALDKKAKTQSPNTKKPWEVQDRRGSSSDSRWAGLRSGIAAAFAFKNQKPKPKPKSEVLFMPRRSASAPGLFDLLKTSFRSRPAFVSPDKRLGSDLSKKDIPISPKLGKVTRSATPKRLAMVTTSNIDEALPNADVSADAVACLPIRRMSGTPEAQKSPTSKTRRLSKLDVRQCFGDMAFVYGKKFKTTVVAETSVEIWSLSTDKIKLLNPVIASRIQKQAKMRMKWTQKRIWDINKSSSAIAKRSKQSSPVSLGQLPRLPIDHNSPGRFLSDLKSPVKSFAMKGSRLLGSFGTSFKSMPAQDVETKSSCLILKHSRSFHIQDIESKSPDQSPRRFASFHA